MLFHIYIVEIANIEIVSVHIRNLSSSKCMYSILNVCLHSYNLSSNLCMYSQIWMSYYLSFLSSNLCMYSQIWMSYYLAIICLQIFRSVFVKPNLNVCLSSYNLSSNLGIHSQIWILLSSYHWYTSSSNKPCITQYSKTSCSSILEKIIPNFIG